MCVSSFSNIALWEPVMFLEHVIFPLRAKVKAAPLAAPVADSCGRSSAGAYLTQRLMVFSTPK
jgi:hypothetical protein